MVPKGMALRAALAPKEVPGTRRRSLAAVAALVATLLGGAVLLAPGRPDADELMDRVLVDRGRTSPSLVYRRIPDLLPAGWRDARLLADLTRLGGARPVLLRAGSATALLLVVACSGQDRSYEYRLEQDGVDIAHGYGACGRLAPAPVGLPAPGNVRLSIETRGVTPFSVAVYRTG